MQRYKISMKSNFFAIGKNKIYFCPLFVTSLSFYTYNRDNDNFKLMKVIQSTLLKTCPLIIWTIIFCFCFSMAGCDSKNEDEDVDPIIIVSNVITTDGEGGNVFFEVTSKNEGDMLSLKIYTRSGVLVFNIEAERCIWDGCSLSGQPLAAGTYHYTAEILGSSPTVSKCGFVHLYR